MSTTHNNKNQQLEQDLEAMLESRHITPMHDDFIAKVIHQAKTIPQQKPNKKSSAQDSQSNEPSLSKWLIELFIDFTRFNPAYALSLFLIMGLCSGFFITAKTVEDNINLKNRNTVQSFLYMDNSLL